jgi:hypothetical protein
MGSAGGLGGKGTLFFLRDARNQPRMSSSRTKVGTIVSETLLVFDFDPSPACPSCTYNRPVRENSDLL